MARPTNLLCGLAALIMWPTVLLAQAPELLGITDDEEISVDAGTISYDRQKDTLSAAGEVTIERGDMILKADTIELNLRTNEAEAVGDASLVSPEGFIRAEEIRLNLDDETGWLIDAELHSTELGYSIWGDRMEKGCGQDYRIENGRFTTCQCEEGPPSWSIAGDELDVDLNGYGRVKGGTFNILDVPVLYVPEAAFPVHQERQSGFLFPRVGLSNRRGFQLLQPYYWDIDKSQDATISVDIETAQRFGLIGEYRYALSPNFQGSILGSYFNESIRGRASETTGPVENPPENRWGVAAEHTQKMGSAVGYADILLVGDDLFLREMNTFTMNNAEGTALRTLPFTTSRIGVFQPWDRAVLQGESVVYQDLIGKESFTLQELPNIRFGGQMQLPFNLLGQMNASVSDWQRSSGITGVRFDFHPELQLRLPLGRAVFGAISAAFRETAYVLTDNEMSGGFRGDDPDGPTIDLSTTSSRELVELRADIGTALTRVFDVSFFGFDKLKHTIEPQLEYLYIPAVSQDDLPVFDGIDRINKRNLVTYGFASRLLARRAADDEEEPGRVYELARVSLAQSFAADQRIAPVDGDGPGDHFSDVDVELRVNPGRIMSARIQSTYDTSDTELSSAAIELGVREPARLFPEGKRPRLLTQMALSFAYRFIRENTLATEFDTEGDIQQIDSGFIVRLTDRIGVQYATRYDIRGNKFLQNYFGFRLLSACDCWSLNVGLLDTSNPDEIQLQAQLTLVGLGSVGTGSGPLDQMFRSVGFQY